MNLAYFYDTVFDKINSVNKKVLMQTKSFTKFGYNTYLIYRNGLNIIFYNYTNNSYEKLSFSNTRDYYNKIIAFIKNSDIKLIYTRKFLLDYFMMDFYKRLHDEVNNIKIIMEFPSIPYDKEVLQDEYDTLEIDMYYRKYLHQYIKFSTNFNNLDEVFGIKSVKIINGFDVQSVPLKEKRKGNDNKIHLVVVSSMSFWNGLERIIVGLRNYYEDARHMYEVYIHFVGDGTEIPKYKRMIEEYNLNDYGIFYGEKYGAELNKIIDKTDIGIINLGLYKVNMAGASSLKISEYASRGLPFVYAFDNYAITDSYKYALKFKNDPSDIDINEIVKFYESMIVDPDYNAKIRCFAEKHLTWDASIEKIIKMF